MSNTVAVSIKHPREIGVLAFGDERTGVCVGGIAELSIGLKPLDSDCSVIFDLTNDQVAELYTKLGERLRALQPETMQ